MSALAPDRMKIIQTVGLMNLILPVSVQKSQSKASVGVCNIFVETHSVNAVKIILGVVVNTFKSRSE